MNWAGIVPSLVLSFRSCPIGPIVKDRTGGNWAGFVSGRGSSRYPRRSPPRSRSETIPAQIASGAGPRRQLPPTTVFKSSSTTATWQRPGRRRQRGAAEDSGAEARQQRRRPGCCPLHGRCAGGPDRQGRPFGRPSAGLDCPRQSAKPPTQRRGCPDPTSPATIPASRGHRERRPPAGQERPGNRAAAPTTGPVGAPTRGSPTLAPRVDRSTQRRACDAYDSASTGDRDRSRLA